MDLIDRIRLVSPFWILSAFYFLIPFIRNPIEAPQIFINMDNQIPLIVCGTGGKVYDDINDIDCLDEKSSLEFFSNNLGYGYIRAFQTHLDITFLNEENVREFNFKIKKKKYNIQYTIWNSR